MHSSDAATVVLKWQRDNASTASAVTALGQTLQLDDIGRDDSRGFATAAYVEVTDDFLELEQQPSDLITATGLDPSGRAVVLIAAPTLAQPARHARARRWDGRIDIDLTSPGARGNWPLERGVQVSLGAGELRPGDYWLIPGRTSNSAGGGTITWPLDDAGHPIAQAPLGIDHHVAALAVVDAGAAAFLTAATNLRECRTLFPPLTAIAASDVSVDPTPCGFSGDVKTVQDAIDELCQSGDGCCTATAVPGPGWEKVFDEVAAGADAQICFPVGEYPSAATIIVTGKGHLVLHGTATGSHLVSTAAVAVLNFTACASVTLEQMTVQGGAGSSGGDIHFAQCGDVVVHDCRFVGGSAAVKQASCLSITGGTVRVATTTFTAGNLQMGIVCIDTARTVVLGSHFDVALLPAGVAGAAVTTATKLERIQARRLLVAGMAAKPPTGNQVSFKIGAQTISFGTVATVKAAWSTALAPSYDSMKKAQKAIDKVMRSVFSGRDDADFAAITAFVKDRIIGRRVAVMSQAVVVAGQSVGDVRIEGNDIANAIQGVHIAASHRGQPRIGPADVAGRVSVRDNRIAILVPPDGARARHAIFVGNADRLRVSANDVSLSNLAEGDPLLSDGVRIYGFIGRAMTVRDNVVDGFPGGITLNLFQARGGDQATLTRMWAVEDNLISAASTPIAVAGPLKAQVKFRGNRPGPADN